MIHDMGGHYPQERIDDKPEVVSATIPQGTLERLMGIGL